VALGTPAAVDPQRVSLIKILENIYFSLYCELATDWKAEEL